MYDETYLFHIDTGKFHDTLDAHVLRNDENIFQVA